MPKTDHTTTPDGVTEAQRDARSLNAAKATAGRKAAVAARRAQAVAAVTDAGIPLLAVSEARLMAAKAELAEIDVAERLGELIPVEKARASVFDRFTTVRTLILGVPSRLAQRDRSITKKQIDLVEELLREALTELADGHSG